VLSIARIYILIPGFRGCLSSRLLTTDLDYVCLPSESYWSSSNHQSRRDVSIRYRHLYMSMDLTLFFSELLHRCARPSTSHVRAFMPSLLYSSLGVLATGSCLVFLLSRSVSEHLSSNLIKFAHLLGNSKTCIATTSPMIEEQLSLWARKYITTYRRVLSDVAFLQCMGFSC